MRIIEPVEVELRGGRIVAVRAAYLTDGPALLLALESVAREGWLGAAETARSVGEARDYISRHGRHDALLLVAMDRGHLAGACGLTPEPDGAPGVLELGMFLTLAWRGSGLAQRLLETALDWARESDWRRVVLSVLLTNQRAIAFYRKMGFVDEGALPVAEHGQREIRMSRSLVASRHGQ